MNLNELRIRKELFAKELQRLESIKTECYWCTNFMNGKCVKFDAAPPLDFLKSGCEEWEWDEIPF